MIFTCTDFDGYYPVGTAAVVIAGCKEEAAVLLELSLKECGLSQIIDPNTLVPIDVEVPVRILCDGNY